MSNGNWSQDEPLSRNLEPQNRELDSADDDALWELFSVYSDGEATQEEVAKIETMLFANPALLTPLNFMQMTGEGARNFVEIEPPLSLTDSILAKTSHRRTFLQKAQSWLSTQNRVLAPGVYRYSFAAGVSLLLMTAWFVSQRIVKPGASGKSQIVALNHMSANPALPVKASDTPTNEVVKNTTPATDSVKKESVASSKTDEAIQVESAIFVQIRPENVSGKLAKSDIALASKSRKEKSDVHANKIKPETVANVVQNLNSLNTHPEQTHNNMPGKDATDSSSEPNLGNSVETPLVSSNSIETLPIIIKPETIQPKTTVASLISRKVNHYAPDSDVMAISFDAEAKRMLAEANRALRAETASNRQYKADIIKGSF